MDEKTRPPAVAGTFYPDDSEKLKLMIEGFLEQVRPGKEKGIARGIVAPHAGYIYSGQVAAHGYMELMKASASVERIILLGPSHYGQFFGAAESGFDFWQTPLGMVKVDSIRGSLENKELVSLNGQVHIPEHSLEVQVPFMQVVMEKDFSLVPLLTGDVVPEVLADALIPLIDEKTFIVASSDLSHYHPYEKAVRLDSIANDAVPHLGFEKLKGAEACGITAIRTLMQIARKRKWKGKMLEYKNSGDTAGDKSKVVGYGSYAFYEG